ncbi:MAG: hypothetical protein ABI352_11575 [Candidatus Dormibacter sp.]
MTPFPDPSPDTISGPSLRVLLRPGEGIPAGTPRSAADGGPYTLRGNTTSFQVSYENALGANGPVLADAVLATCERDYASLRTWFGGLNPGGLPFTVFVVTGTFGAYHASCAATELHLAAFDGTNADLVRMLMVAEADEVMMAAQNAGWDCGASHGEGLSRVLSTEVYPAQLDGFATAASWLDSNRPDWVTTTEPTDQNYVSIGCATLFLNYLRHQLGYDLTTIVGGGAPTLAQVYTHLSGKTDAFSPFNALLAKRFPAGRPSGLSTDNPFPF